MQLLGKKTDCLPAFVLMLILMVGAFASCAAEPKVGIVPLSEQTVAIPVNGVGLKQYRVINHSKRIKTLVYKKVEGISQRTGHSGECAIPFTLSPNASCILSLQIGHSSLLQPGGIIASPVVCVKNPQDNSPSPLMCYRASSDFQYQIVYPLSIQAIPEQNATANIAFRLNLKNKIAYFDENVNAGKKPLTRLSPSPASLGLQYDAATGVLQGRPKATGVYAFTLSASNADSQAAPRKFHIKVAANARETPRFGQQRRLPSATPEKVYRADLLPLLEQKASYMQNNQVSFRIDHNHLPNNARWLSLRDGRYVTGEVPAALAGQSIALFIVAHSNTGGDSKPVAVTLPIALDPQMKPTIADNIAFSSQAGGEIFYDVRPLIDDPTQDSALTVRIDSVQPSAAWLSVAQDNPTRLLGVVPVEATGVAYHIRLHAHNTRGGDSEPQSIILNIERDVRQTPFFRDANPVFPLLHPGQPFFHDFVADADVYPGFDEYPYEVMFASDYQPPSWLRLEKNQLWAEMVPDKLADDLTIQVVLRNIPGGCSENIALNLYVAN
ncbi:MAG: hypothetical protein JJT82_06135 [Legionellaceae bacterium]|nr:hypothetical protein [Legionellaceae bacterium]